MPTILTIAIAQTLFAADAADECGLGRRLAGSRRLGLLKDCRPLLCLVETLIDLHGNGLVLVRRQLWPCLLLRSFAGV